MRERIGVVTGLAAEAACLRRAGERIETRCAGADFGRAGIAAAGLAAGGCAALVSFGLCGGLAPDVTPGTLLLPDQVIDDAGTCHPIDAAWRQRLMAVLAAADLRGGTLLSGAVAVLDPREKRRLHEATGAAAVDMESAAVARVADRHRLPFLVVRAVADASGTAVPAIAAAAVGSDGRPRLAPLLRHLAARPALLPALIRLGRDAGRGMATLRGVAALAGGSGFEFGLQPAD